MVIRAYHSISGTYLYFKNNCIYLFISDGSEHYRLVLKNVDRIVVKEQHYQITLERFDIIKMQSFDHFCRLLVLCVHWWFGLVLTPLIASAWVADNNNRIVLYVNCYVS